MKRGSEALRMRDVSRIQLCKKSDSDIANFFAPAHISSVRPSQGKVPVSALQQANCSPQDWP
jgi:hypothetical protein